MSKDNIIKSKLHLASQRELLVETLKLPKDSLLGASIVTLTGNGEAVIQNYRGIIEYTEERILLQGKRNKICFEGQKLKISYYTNEDMKIEGHIECVSYF